MFLQAAFYQRISLTRQVMPGRELRARKQLNFQKRSLVQGISAFQVSVSRHIMRPREEKKDAFWLTTLYLWRAGIWQVGTAMSLYVVCGEFLCICSVLFLLEENQSWGRLCKNFYYDN